MTLIAQISDLHLVPEGTLCYGRVDTNALARQAIAALNRLRTPPDAVVVTGDIIDTAKPQDYALAKDILAQLEMPYYLVSGNHDQTAGLRQSFAGYDFVVAEFPDRLCYVADIGPIRLIALDSSVPHAPHGALSAEQLSFLEEELYDAGDRPALIAIHHPPIATGNQSMDRFQLIDASELAAVVSRHRNVVRILCGHCHRAVFGTFAGTTVAIAPATGHQLEIALDGDDTFGFNLEPPAYFLHRWTEGEGLTTQLAMVERYAGPYPFVWENVALSGAQD